LQLRVLFIVSQQELSTCSPSTAIHLDKLQIVESEKPLNSAAISTQLQLRPLFVNICQIHILYESMGFLQHANKEVLLVRKWLSFEHVATYTFDIHLLLLTTENKGYLRELQRKMAG
jgi:hypothetical protein